MKSESVIQTFEKQVKNFPDNIALEYEEKKSMELWPSVAEYFVYDDVLYGAMANDTFRNESYKNAISKLVKDKVVVEIGTGAEAILARFCAEAGAKKVYAVEILEKSYLKAKERIKELNLEDNISLIHGDATKVELPEKADVCVSEIVGAIGGSEGAAVIINDARRFLKRNGVMLPIRSVTKIAAISLPDEFLNNLGFSKIADQYTNNIFEYVGKPFDLRICIKNFDKEFLMSNSDVFEDLYYHEEVDVNHKHEISLEIHKDGLIQGFLLWLNLYIDNIEKVDILEQEYCWIPVFVPVFYLGVQAKKGTVINLEIERKLCINGINPDYRIKGSLRDINNELIKFDYELPHYGRKFKSSLFYQKIFEQGIQEKKIHITKKMTYDELNCYTNQLAHYFIDLGIKKSKKVGVLVDDSKGRIGTILAILKTGAAFLPIDLKYYSKEMITKILKEDYVDAIITTNNVLLELSEVFLGMEENKIIISLDKLKQEISLQSEDNLEMEIDNNLAYIIFTSGTTGKPKGVMLGHYGLANLAKSQIRIFDINESSKVLQFASCSFDASISEIFTALLSGATLYLPTKDNNFLCDLNSIIRDKKITVATIPPSVLKNISSEGLNCLKTIISAGESCSLELIKKWSEGRKFINAYGPTEGTVCATAGVCKSSDQKITIGKPIDNMQVYILDNDFNEVDKGEIGEIYISGVGIAFGYLDQTEVTSEKFFKVPAISNQILYKTGDLGRVLQDDNIEFLGRVDDQIKIRGYRIETAEIEYYINQFTSIKESVVLDYSDSNGNKKLLAYIVTNDAIDVNDLKSYLLTELETFKIPFKFVVIDKIPLTQNGKINKKALRLMNYSYPSEKKYEKAKNEEEVILQEIWKKVFDMQQIDMNESFYDMGGDSLVALQIVSTAKDEGVIFTINDIYKHETIRNIVENVLNCEVIC